MVRQSELAVARRAARLRPRPARQGVQTAQLVGIDEGNAGRVIVSFDGSEVSVLAGAGKLVPGSLVSVEVDALGAPVRVHGAVTVRPEGLDDDLPAPEPVEPMPELAPRELTEAEAQAIQETADGLADALADLEDARTEAETNFSTLDEKLGQAFPGGVFDVPGAIAAAETDVLAQAALDAQAKAEAAASAAQTAAEQFAAGEISEAELRAANDAQAKADVAKADAIAQAQADLAALEAGAVATAQAAADAAATAASAAQGTADDAYELADDAMRTADGKNVATYSTVTSAPGAAPTTASGQGRAQFDVHRNRLADGTIVGEWMWSGSSWVRVHLGDAMLRSLDVGKLTAGAGSFAEAVITRLWADLAVINRLQAVTGWVGGTLLADGAVTTRTLNVVPDEGAGGVEILPPGLRIIPGDETAGTAVSLRVDEPNWLSFAQDGVSTFSVSPEGELATETVNARQALAYRGEELSEILDALPKGLVAFTKMTQAAIVGTAPARLVMATIETPEAPRAYKLIFGFHRQSAERMQITFRQSIGTTVSNANSIQSYWYVAKTAAATADYVEIAHIIPDTVSAWGAGNTVTFGFFAQSMVSGNTITFDPNHGVTMTVEDIGPATDVINSVPYVPSSGGGSGQGSDSGTVPTKRTSTFASSGFRTFPNSGTRHVRANQSVVQGYIAGLHSYGHWYFPSVTSTLNGASGMSGTLTIRNEHTGSSAGMTIGLWAHNYASNPGSFGNAAKIADIHVGRGQTKTITLPANVLNGLKAGTIKGFGLSHGTNTSLNWYGYFSPSATLRLNYSK